MSASRLQSSIEALLFASDQPLTLALLAEAIEAPVEDVSSTLHALGEEYAARQAGVQLREMAGGWLFMTAPEQNDVVTRMLRGKRKARLSRAALETLAIAAYKQPVTKSEMEAIRGVDCSGTLATLLERDLVTIKGRSTVVGRPLLYGTTQGFLDYFGLRELAELPRPEELRALIAAREPEQMEMLELEPAEGTPLELAVAASQVLSEDAVAAAPTVTESESDDELLAEADEALAEGGYRARAQAHEDVDFLEEEAMGGGDLDVAEADELELSADDEDDEDSDLDDEDDDDDDEDYDDDLDDDEDEDDEDDDDEIGDESDEEVSAVLRRSE